MNKVVVAISFLIMIFVNAIANIIPLNGYTTGEVSDLYKNLFAPDAITFAIWGLIYVLLAIYVVYQLFFNKKNSYIDLYEKIGFYFTLSCIANSAWIFLWHFLQIGFSFVFMLVLLFCLIAIYTIIDAASINLKHKTLLKIPFSVYLGWITVATIANAAAFIVSLGWNAFSITSIFITVIILFIGILIASIIILKNNDIAYGLVIIWAYSGILIKHISSDGFVGEYPVIIAATILSIIMLNISVVYVIMNKIRK